MKVEIGDILVFTGNEAGVSHYNNFITGKQYIVRDISVLSYGLDDIYHEHSVAVLFENENYGTYLHEVNKYFIHLDEYRNKKIDELYD